MVLIARALAAEPSVLILDEPESNLDFKVKIAPSKGGTEKTLTKDQYKLYVSSKTEFDSDDWLECDAIENILKIHKQYRDKIEFCG